MKTKKNLKLAIVLFAMIFTVGAAFAATNGMLAFGGTVRINSVGTVARANLEFTHALIGLSNADSSHQSRFDAEARIVEENGRQKIAFDVNVLDLEDLLRPVHLHGWTGTQPMIAELWPTIFVDFEFTNVGITPIKISGIENSSGIPPFFMSMNFLSAGHSEFHSPGFPDVMPISGRRNYYPHRPEWPSPVGNVVQPGQTVGGTLMLHPELFVDFIGSTSEQHTFTYWIAINYEQSQ